MGLLVRTWNVFHGRTVPERGELHLERMLRLVTEDGPGMVALQEVPVWALAHLERWSGMRTVAAVVMPALGGRLAERLTQLDARRLRSALTGQANALLLAPDLAFAGPPQVIRLNPRSARRTARAPVVDRLEWAWNRRVCQAVPVLRDGARILVANLHASKQDALARLELERLTGILPEGAAVVCGDFNAAGAGLAGFSAPIAGIDQIVVRGLELEEAPRRWPDERRRLGDELLSDHAPVEAVIA